MRKEKLLLKNLVQAVHTFLKKELSPKTSSNKTISTPSVHGTTPDKPAPVLPVSAKSHDGVLPGRGKDDAPKTGSKPSGTKASRPSWQVSRFVVPEVEGQFRFHDLGLPTPIMHAISDLGFKYCTPIQAEILPKALTGSDVTGKAQTGTGKSAAFLINIYAHLLKEPIKGKRSQGAPRVLIMAPTRELVLQIEKDARGIGKYTRLRIQSILGGMQYDKQKQVLLKNPIDIMVATPGRLLDFQRQGILHLNKVEILVIDEADRMLDMGFIPDIRKIVHSTPHKNERQTMFFSATLKPEVERLAEQWTKNPVHVEIEPEHIAAESVRQLVYIVTADEKFALLMNLIVGQKLERVLVFVNRRDQTRRLSERLQRYQINCAILSGEVPQNKRIKTLENFRNGRVRVLVATDVAARGLHVEGISHVINFTLPTDPEDYVHRIGRTGRAGASGISVSFADEDDSFYIPAIEEYLGNPLVCEQPDEALLALSPPPRLKRPATQKKGAYAGKRASSQSAKQRTRQGSRARKPHQRNRTNKPKVSGVSGA
ncbi:MAG: DEAD/DEAH box helicase [Deltaproteobacteria bacterium]|nr:DEAD/DEAH box helicase [Deltaproteobacteria bacterium]